MSSQSAAQVVPNILIWLKNSYILLLPLKAGVLMERLAKEGQIEASFALARGLLQLSEKQASHPTDEGLFGPRREIAASFDDYEYKTILESNVPGFIQAAGIEGLALLCELLEPALRIEAAQMGGPPADASYIWRPSIADHEQNHDWYPHDFLVTSIRDSSDLLISEGAPLSEVAEVSGNRNWHVFARIAMYLGSKWVDRDAGPAIQLMLRRDLFSAYEVSHEYEMLLEAVFARSSELDQRVLLEWIQEGPDLGAYTERVIDDRGALPTTDELLERADRWRWERLAHLPLDVLPRDWQLRSAALAERYGSPTAFPLMTSGYVGTPNPVEKPDVEAWTTEQLARYVDQLPESSDRFASPEEGYASVLESIAEEQPEKLSRGLGDFIGRKPVYLRSILRGLERAIGERADHLDWFVIVAVADWIMAQPRAIEGGSGGSYSDLDPGWVWTRGTLADLVEKGLRVQGVTPALRGRLWTLLQHLMSDPDTGDDHDPDAAETSLNTIRGKAMYAIIAYARWVFEIVRSQTGTAPAQSFSTVMPEVGEELDARLDASLEPSKPIRAVFGTQLRLLAWLDFEWLASRVQRIFSLAPDGHFDSLGRAAWQAYVLYGRASLNIMELLIPQYEVAISDLERTRQTVGDVEESRPFGPTDRPRMLLDNCERHLADHVMVLYWHGRLGDDPLENDLVRGLFEKGNVAVRHRALEFLGRSLREAGSELAEVTADRLKRLLEVRLEAATTGTEADRKEVRAFGWWMESQALDPDWLTRNLLGVLRLSKRIDVDYLVVSALVNMDDPYLLVALRSLVLIIRADTEGWGVHGWKDSAYRLIQRGVESHDPDSVELATDAANTLIARGFHEFRELVPLEK
jgi:hypothetical protein